MDERAIQRLSRELATAPSRRAMLGILGGGMLAGLGRGRANADEVSEEAFGLCRLPGAACGEDSQCCALRCREGICGCKKRGKKAIIAALCCSGKKKKGSKGECR